MIKYTEHESNTAEISIRSYIGVNMAQMYEKKVDSKIFFLKI